MLETEYIADAPLEHRKKFGQYFTPSLVANRMVKWIMKSNPNRILDPAFGLGIFFDEIKKYNNINGNNNGSNVTGFEIDGHILSYVGDDNGDLIIYNENYLTSRSGKYGGIVCNPPYMRFQKFLNRHEIIPIVEEIIGEKISRYSNIASLFLMKSLSELEKYGRLAYIMPFEFFNTGYGKKVKEYLIKRCLLKQIIIFQNETEIFPEATTTVSVLLCEKDEKRNDIKITIIKSKEELTKVDDISSYHQKTIEPEKLPYHKKWTPIILSKFSEQPVPDGFCRIDLYGSFKRGIATGANKFFALNRSKIKEFNITENNTCKCITKSRQIKKAVFNEADFQSLADRDKPVYCLDIKDHEDPNIKRYLRHGIKQGYNQRYLTRNRNPWYKIEDRTPAPILFGVFNRGRVKVIRNYTSAINFTCFHSFFPNFLFGKKEVDKLFIYFLSDIGQSIIKYNKRKYGRNLDKFEPGDLNDCMGPNQDQFAMLEKDAVDNIIDIAHTDMKEAINRSNELIHSIL